MYNVNISDAAFNALEDHSWKKDDVLDLLKNAKKYTGKTETANLRFHFPRLTENVIEIPCTYRRAGLFLILDKQDEIIQILMDRSRDRNNTGSSYPVIWEK